MLSALLLLVLDARILASPQITVDKPRWDFGAVTNSIQLKHEFIIRNSGDEPLQISQVISSCNACLVAGIDKTNIPPNNTAVVRSYLDLRQLHGSETRMITLESNDPRTPSYVLELAVVAVPCYSIQPLGIDLDLSQGQQSSSAQITPLIKLRAPLLKTSCSGSNITARIEQRLANQYVLVLEALKTTPRGDSAYGITISSADSNDPPCWVLCHIRNPPDLELIPPRLILQPQDEPQMHILWVKQHSAAPSILLDAIPQSDKFHCEIDPDANGYDYRIYVTARQQEKAAGQTNALVLRMRDQNQHEQSIKVPMMVAQTDSKSR